jgi:hypothetical protein
MGDREELQELRRLAELEAKAGGGATATTTPDPGIGNVMMNAVPKGVANLVNTPVTLWNLAKQAAGAIHPQIKDYMQQTPNYPMQAAESIGLVDPAKNPQTAGQRIADAAVQGGVGALAGPGGFLKNAATGMAAGGVGQTTTEVTGSPLAGMAAGALTPFALRGYSKAPQLNAVADQTAQAGRKAGYVVPPSQINPTFFNEKLESMSGKAAIAQEANLRNQGISDALANRYLGVPDKTALTRGSLKGMRDKAGEVYEEVSKLRPTEQSQWFPRYHETDLVEQMKQAKADAGAANKAYFQGTTYDPSLRDKAKALEATAHSIEGDLTQLAKDNGKEELIKQLANARTKIAKTHTVENALNVGDAGISAPVIGRMLDKGDKLGSELELIGKYQQAFPQFMREGAGVPSPGVSGTDAAMAAGLGMGGYGAAGPAGWLAAGLPLVRGPARAMALSDWYQNRLFRQPVPSEALGDTATRSALIADILAARQQQGVQ